MLIRSIQIILNYNYVHEANGGEIINVVLNIYNLLKLVQKYNI